MERAAAELAKARQALTDAVTAASAAGHSNREIARHADMSHEGVRKMLATHKPAAPVVSDEDTMRARLATIDGKWDAFVDRILPMFMPPEQERRREQAYRNVNNAKAKRQQAGVTRSGRPAGASAAKLRVLPTVTVEARVRAEKYALELLEHRSGDPFVIEVIAMLDESEALRQALQAIDDSRVPFLAD